MYLWREAKGDTIAVVAGVLFFLLVSGLAGALTPSRAIAGLGAGIIIWLVMSKARTRRKRPTTGHLMGSERSRPPLGSTAMALAVILAVPSSIILIATAAALWAWLVIAGFVLAGVVVLRVVYLL